MSDVFEFRGGRCGKIAQLALEEDRRRLSASQTLNRVASEKPTEVVVLFIGPRGFDMAANQVDQERALMMLEAAKARLVAGWHAGKEAPDGR